MHQRLSFILFLIVFLGVLGAGHSYLLWRALHWVKGSRGQRAAVIVGVALLFAVTLIAIFLGRDLPRERYGWVSFAGYLWLGVAFYWVLLLLVGDGVRLVRWVGRWVRGGPARAGLDASAGSVSRAVLTRRDALRRSLEAGAALAAVGCGAVGVKAACGDLQVREVPVRLERLPKALSGLRVALITDLHVGPILGADFMRRVVARVNELRADVVAVTGDIVDGAPGAIEADVAPLTGLRSRYGTFVVTGNHEYYSGAAAWVATYRKLGLPVLINEAVRIADGATLGPALWLGGVADAHAARFIPEHANDFVRTFASAPADDARVLLAHQPVQVFGAARHGVDLQLSGHTHGGQLWPFGGLTRLVQPYLYGLHQHEHSETQIYVSRGTGFWGPPMRVLAPAEITLLTLHV